MIPTSIIFHLLPFQQILYLTCLGAILRMHPGKLSKSLDFGIVSPGGEALAKFLGKARFGHYEFNGATPSVWEASVFPKNGPKVLPKFDIFHFLQLDLINSSSHRYEYRHVI